MKIVVVEDDKIAPGHEVRDPGLGTVTSISLSTKKAHPNGQASHWSISKPHDPSLSHNTTS